MDEDPADPTDHGQLNTARPREAARAETQLGLGAEYLGIYTQTLQRMPRFIQITTGYLQLAPGQPSALRRLRLRLELFASQDLLIK